MTLTGKIVGFVLVGAGLLLAACGGGDGNGILATFTLNGTIYSAAGNRADSDVNDQSADYFEANDDFGTAQMLTAPVVLGGYVNLPRRGAMGATYASGDTSDFFNLSLTEGAVVRLVLPDGTDGDTTQVSLLLYGENRELIDSLDTITPSAAIAVPDAGNYFVEVQAVAGASSYLLIVDLPMAATQSVAVGPDAEWVPGEVLVRFKENRSAGSSTLSERLVRSSGLRFMSRSGRGWVRFRTDDLAGTLRRLNMASSSDLSSARTARERHRALCGDTLRLVNALRQRADVALAEPNYIRRPHFVPDDSLYPLQWHLDMIHLPSAWDLTQGSEDVIVAIIDTGVINHPDLADQLVAGYDFISSPDNAGDGDGMDADPTDPGDGENGDSTFHGTHVAGTVAAAFNNAIGVAGVGGRTRIMPVRVLGRQGGWDSDIAKAIRWAAGIDVTNEAGNTIPGADPPADIINMSFGGQGTTKVLTEAIEDAHAAGAVLLSSAGNSADTTVYYPAAYDVVVSVNAVDAQAQLTLYSTYGPTIDVAAPGGNVYSDIQPDGYGDGILSTAGSDADGTIRAGYSFANGTSMAAPHVAGVAALMKAVSTGMTPSDFRAYLAGGALTDDLGPDGKDNRYGHGLINAHKAVVAAGELSPPAVLSVTPRALYFDNGIDTATLSLSAIGQGNLTLEAVTSSQPWLAVAKATAGDFGQYQVTVDRGQLTGGLHDGSLAFTPTTGDAVTVAVSVVVLPDTHSSVGTQYVLLVDATTMEVVMQQKLTLAQGRYPFEFTNVPRGTYYLLCGSDIDGDTRITDQGEAVGGYPSVEQWRLFSVTGDMSGLDFVTGFTQFPYQLPGDATVLPQ